MNNLPKILVIIVTWKNKEFVLALLRSLEGLVYPIDKLDVLVVDNASNDGTAEAIRSGFEHVKLLVNSENLGGCGGFNTGLAWAYEQDERSYDYLWLLDNDVLVQERALLELVELLERHEDVAIAGSTMMQLTWPWRINEMGAFVDRHTGQLHLHLHKKDVDAFKGIPMDELLRGERDLSVSLENCPHWMDVDYVAAASLLIRASVARQAGLWDDYFIHFDDVEWCLRLGRMGHRIVVSARSLIWHLPAENKVPTWIQYYDNRNVLFLVRKHAGDQAARRLRRRILKKSLYNELLGKRDIAFLLREAVADFDEDRTGKKEIKLDRCYHEKDYFQQVLSSTEIRRVLIPWTVDMLAVGVQGELVRLMKKRPELRIDYLVPPSYIKKALKRQVPGAVPISLPEKSRMLRYIWLLRRRKSYDVVFQSDYQPLLSLMFIGKKILFVNYEGSSLRLSPRWRVLVRWALHALLA